MAPPPLPGKKAPPVSDPPPPGSRAAPTCTEFWKARAELCFAARRQTRASSGSATLARAFCRLAPTRTELARVQQDSQPQSDGVQVLLRFLRLHRDFASIVAGVNNYDLTYLNHEYNPLYLNHDGSVSRDDLRIRSIVLSLLNFPQVRASLDWERVRDKASEIVYDLVFQSPELIDLALLPRGSLMPHDVLPIVRSHRRRYVKEQDLPRAKSLARLFLRIRKRIPSSTRNHELNTRLTDKARKWLVDIIDQSLRAGRLELQSSGKKKGVPSATVLHTMSNTLTDLTRSSVAVTSSLANAGALVAPVSQIVSGTLTVPSKISGAPVAAVPAVPQETSHAESFGISAEINAGVPGPTVLHTMSNNFTNLTRNSVSGTSSLANAGILAEHH